MINNRRKLESAGTLGKNMILTPCTLAYFTDIIVKLYKYMQGNRSNFFGLEKYSEEKNLN